MDVYQVIKDFGFPVACVAGLAWFIRSLMAEHKLERKELVESVVAAVGKSEAVTREHRDEYRELAARALAAHTELAIAQTKVASGLEAVAKGQDEVSKTLYRVKCAYASGQLPAAGPGR